MEGRGNECVVKSLKPSIIMLRVYIRDVNFTGNLLKLYMLLKISLFKVYLL